MKTDPRYTIAREFCGHAKPQFVARFAGEWIGCAPTRKEARIIATSHAFARSASGVAALRVRPADDYELLATRINISRRKVYEASVASNQPNWKEKEIVFIDGILLQRGEYFAIPAR